MKLSGLKVMVNTHLVATVTAEAGRVVHYKSINIRWILMKKKKPLENHEVSKTPKIKIATKNGHR